MFEVGKKYIKNGYVGPLFEPLFVGTQYTFGKASYDDQYWEETNHNNDFSNWKEYKEPQKLTAWVAVFLNADGVIYFGEHLYYNEQAARTSCKGKIDVVEISYTEK
jgi:hypothetical protein